MTSPLGEVARYFLRLGFTAFGGPAAHVAMMRQDLVARRKWLDDQHFLDLLGVTNLIPGPNSSEMAMHLGRLRAGWPGLIVGGACFIGPAMLIVLVLAWAYVEFGTLPVATGLLYGVKPVIIAVVLQALWGLLRTALKGPVLVAVAVLAAAGYLAGLDEIALLFGLALLALGWYLLGQGRARAASLSPAPLPFLAAPVLAQAAAYSSATLFLTFLKIGAVLYGSGYVLLAFLQNDFVTRLGWLTEQQLLDAVAIGQFTPGPVFTTATFIGYIVGGVPGGILATIAIFLPGFVYVGLIHRLVGFFRAHAWTSALLDGVNAAALGLMGGVTLTLGRAAIVDGLTMLIVLASLIALVRYKVNSVWLIVAGAIVGWITGGAGGLAGSIPGA